MQRPDAKPGPASGPHPDKGSWRRTLRKRRRRIHPLEAQQAADHICRLLCDEDCWITSSHVGLYLASDGEVNTTPIANASQAAMKSLYLPVVEGRDMKFAPWSTGQPLRKNRFDIGEPISPTTQDDALDLILLPLVGFATSGARLGRGGGFYDRFLQRVIERAESTGSHRARPHLVGLAYECQRSEGLERLREPWDIPLEAIITEERVYLGAQR